MNRRTFLATTAAAGVTGALADTPDDEWPTNESVAAEYKKAMEFFRAALPEKLASVPPAVENDTWMRHMKAAGSEDEAYVLVMSPLDRPAAGIVRVSKTGQLLLAGASVIADPKAPIRPVPQWSIAAAIENASSWLKRFGWAVPTDFQVGKAEYDLGGNWQILWHHVYGVIPELQRQGTPADTITVMMEEDGSGLRFIRDIRGPQPATTTSKITRTEGVILAAKALPSVMATGIYKSWMPPGMSPLSFHSAELCVVRPNWLLDPKRYSLNGPKGPPERRLCWQVTFELSRREKSGEKNGKPVYSLAGQGQVFVDVDAVTGEVVGGDMLGMAHETSAGKPGER